MEKKILYIFIIIVTISTFVLNNNIKIVFADDPVGVDVDKTNTTNNSVYTLLAPLPGLTTAPDNVGDYFNLIFKLAIGLCAVLAVVMIVIGGVQYMGNDSIFGKTQAKERIMAAILGLIIALGAYALLNTINPDLLGGGGVSIKQVSAEIDNEVESTPWEGTSSGDNTTLCPSGFENASVPWGDNNHKNINVCKSIKPDLVKLLNTAHDNKIYLSGSGSRTKAEQQKFREEHGCPDPNASSKSCHPETARPGHSMHESGMAVDFKCDKKKMTSSDDCYKWLKQHAGEYGFKNLKSEPWHWSAGKLAGH